MGIATNTRVHGSRFYYMSAYLRAYANMLLKRQEDTSARPTVAKQPDHTQLADLGPGLLAPASARLNAIGKSLQGQ